MLEISNLFNQPTAAIHMPVGALPPGPQRNRELLAILNDPRVYEILGSVETIEGIEKTETGYQVTSKNCSFSVEVIYLKAHNIGPVRFELVFGEPIWQN